ncbi:MAG: hypothetical protein EHM24_25780 [Acidobacteria bacterium]|nr:MAG: hypothetical protein EHM24_25780 [Acidobacteriota bacterium]
MAAANELVTARQVLVASLLAAAPLVAAAAPTLPTYAVGSIPVAPGSVSVEFPIHGDFQGELGALVLGQGTYDNHNPFAYLSAASPFAWVHFDVVPNVRLSAAFQEIFYREVAPLGLRDAHEERLVTRARLQQPRGTAALYELFQLDVRSFDDPGGTHRIVYRPRFRIGQGLNLDAVRIHSLVLFQEVAFRFSDSSYTERAFESFRAFVGYMWTTRRGAFVTLGFVGQISLNPAATRYDFLYGPALNVAYRFRSAAKAEAPPVPPDVDVP